MQDRTVLFVDDEPEILSAIRRRMRSEPYKCRFSTTGEEALGILSENPVHVLVTDMGMPGMDGLALLKKSRAQYPDMIRVVLSGAGDGDTIISAINEGEAHRYITKPWDDRELKITIRQAIDLFNLYTQNKQLMLQLKERNLSLEQEVKQRVAQLLSVQGQAEIGRYASEIVHNLNNPLHALCNYLEFADYLLSNPLPDSDDQPVDLASLKDKINSALASAKDLKDISGSILAHAREKVDFHIDKVDINEIIEKEVKYFQLDPLFKRDIQKTIELDENVSSLIGNRLQIKQVIDNLIKNSLDAMEGSPIKKLGISTASMDKYVIFKITDTGHGVEKENLEKLFLPTYTTKPPGKGTGLGLASVKEIIDAYKGTIRVESAPGKGTRVTVRLPVSPTTANAGWRHS
ncbi:MAG: hybrid sensor histidine kinase/response regulator [Desulfobacteraceae bacterium]|nr:hybrid sensor histidine kinase/response regulator [Desulfobacteraceae bacterium]